MNRILKLSTIFIIAVSFSSCSFIQTGKKTVENNNQFQNNEKQEEVNFIKYPTLEESIGVLCSDEFQGRAIGSDGNELAAEYIERAFKSLELSTLFEDSYYQIYYQGVKSIPGSNDNERKLKELKNVVGVIKGKDPKKAVIISAHFDHIGYKDGNIVRGALDNASGVAALLEMANILKEKSKEYTFNMDIVFCAFNGEERRYGGSGAFINAIKSDIYSKFYNINIDCIGAKEGGKLALKNRSKSSDNLYNAVKSILKKNNVEFADTEIVGGSDHLVFESIGIPNILIIDENVRGLIHKPADTPEILDYEKISNISRSLCDFIISNDGITFE